MKKSRPTKVMVAIPNQGDIKQEVALQLLDMATESIVHKKYEIDIRFSKISNIDYNRNSIVKMFLESDNEYLLMIDDDNPCLKNPLDLLDLKKDVIIYPTFMYKTDEHGNPAINYNVFKKIGRYS